MTASGRESLPARQTLDTLLKRESALTHRVKNALPNSPPQELLDQHDRFST